MLENIQELENLFNNNIVDREFLRNFSKNYKVNYVYKDNNMERILLYNRFRINEPNIVSCNCNGLILERTLDNGWKIVCRPLPAFRNISLFSETQDMHIFPVTESTIINMYFSLIENKWCFATKKAFDISGYEWRGVKYSDIINKFENLKSTDKQIGTTYIFSVAVPELHIFNKISKCDLIGKASETDTECYWELDTLTFETMVQNNKSALSRFYKTNERHLGYIIRGTQGCYIMESSLMRKINELVYKPEFSRDPELRNQYISYNSDMLYVIAKCYVKETYKNIMKLFPEFKSKLHECRGIDRDFEEYCVNILVNKPKIENIGFRVFYQKHENKLTSINAVKRFIKEKTFKEPKFYRDIMKYNVSLN